MEADDDLKRIPFNYFSSFPFCF